MKKIKNVFKKLWTLIKKYKKWIIAAIILILILLLIVKVIYPKYRQSVITDKDWLESHISIVHDYDMGASVYVVKKPDDVSIYNLDYQEIISDKIEDLLSTTEYTLSYPLIIYNPYGTNNNAVNIYYTDDEEEITYTISAKDTEDYTKTVYSNSINDSYYESQIIGLVNGEINTVTIDDTTFTVELEENTKVDTTLEVTDGDSTEELSDGLFALLGHDKNFNSNIYLYDNDGLLRSELPLDSYRTDRIIFIGDEMIYSYTSSGFIKVNGQGKITDIYDIDGYTLHHDFIYDEENNKLLILANKNGADTIEDRVISYDLETNEVEEIINMQDYLTEYYDTAISPEGGNTYGGDELDWIHLNSLSLTDDGLLLSSREFSTIIKMTDIYDEPELQYLLADESIVLEEYEDYAYTKVGNFVSHAGQHTVTYSTDDSLKDGQYYISIFDNNFGNSRTRPDFDWSNYEGVGTYDEGDKSMYYKYLVDENKKTYTLVESFDVPYSSIVSSVQDLDDTYVVSSGKSHVFGEYDSDGTLIREYSYTSKKYAYRTFKYTFDSIWFK